MSITMSDNKASGNTDPGIPIRAFNEYAFCPRLYFLMYIDGLWSENADTLAGGREHINQSRSIIRNSETKKNPIRMGKVVTETSNSESGNTSTENEELLGIWEQIPRNLYFGDSERGVHGKLDAIEVSPHKFAPVESKHSSGPVDDNDVNYEELQLPGTAYINDQAQLSAQIYVLKENGYTCDSGYIYYRRSKRRVCLKWSDGLDRLFEKLYNGIKGLWQSMHRPDPLLNSEKCIRCSLSEVCLPDEINYLKDTSSQPRRIIASRYDRSLLHVIDSQCKVGVSGENLEVKKKGKVEHRYHIKDIASVSIYGNAQVTTQAIGVLLDRGISLMYFSSAHRLKGGLYNFQTKNTEARIRQYELFRDGNPKLASAIIAAKISNQRVFIRRNGNISDDAYASLKELITKAEECKNPEQLLGLEGTAARIYFKHFGAMLNAQAGSEFQIDGRNRRPPRDPVNAMLSFAYSMLLRDSYNACIAVGLDPEVGFFHKRVPGRPALALDIMEAYRPIWADSAVIRAINTGMVQSDDFQLSPAGCVMKRAAREGLIKAYEARADTMVTHPEFSYVMSYRRILEVEVRLLLRYLEGDAPEWKPMRVR